MAENRRITHYTVTAEAWWTVRQIIGRGPHDEVAKSIQTFERGSVPIYEPAPEQVKGNGKIVETPNQEEDNAQQAAEADPT